MVISEHEPPPGKHLFKISYKYTITLYKNVFKDLFVVYVWYWSSSVYYEENYFGTILKKISWNSESAEFPEKLKRNVKFLNKHKTIKNYIYIVWHRLRLMCYDGFDEYILCEFLLFFLCKILLLFIEWRQSSSHDRHFLYFVHKIININIQQLRFSFDKMNKIYKNETETYLHMKSLANPALY